MVRDLKPLHSALSEAINSLETFGGADLTQTLARIEGSLQAVTLDGYAAVLAECRAKAEVLGAAALVKRLASQINVVVHALGILLCLPRILRPGEAIDYVSLGAGNTGRAFDLETNQRIAEFKFIPPSDFPRGVAQRLSSRQIDFVIHEIQFLDHLIVTLIS